MKQCIFVPSYNENNKYTKGDKILYESETKHGGILVMAKLNIKKSIFVANKKSYFDDKLN